MSPTKFANYVIPVIEKVPNFNNVIATYRKVNKIIVTIVIKLSTLPADPTFSTLFILRHFIYFAYLSVIGAETWAEVGSASVCVFLLSTRCIITHRTCLQLVPCLQYLNTSFTERCSVILFQLNSNVGILRRSVIRTQRSDVRSFFFECLYSKKVWNPVHVSASQTKCQK